MSFNHRGLGSPVSPISSRQNSFGPSSQNHAPGAALQHEKKPSAPTQAVSPLSAQFPDSPTRGYLSPVSIVSPKLSFPPGLLHHDHHRAPSAPEVPQTVRPARGGTLHLQDHMPFKQPAPPPARTTTTTTTRFPSRRPVPAGPHQASAGDHKGTTQELDEETAPWSSSERPVTTYLADHQPHRLAAPPTATKPHPNNNSVKSTQQTKPPHHRPAGPTFRSMGLQDVELGDVTTATTTTTTTTKIAAAARPATAAAPMIVISESESEEEIAERTAYEVKRRRRNCIIGCVFCPTLVAIIVVFAVLVIQVNKP